MQVEGFTTNVAHYMALSDFFIGKPGPGSISEALQFDLPVILERNNRTMPQERYNADWVREHRAGIVLESFREISSAAHRMIRDLDSFRANVGKIKNQAVYEIPEILDGVLRKKRA